MPDGPVRDAEIPPAEDTRSADNARAPEGDAERAAEHEQECVPDDRLLRALADVDNLRKRFDREVARARADERIRAAQSWLPVVDNLELALDHAGPECAPLAEGLRAVRDQAVALLAALGFPRFEDEGQAFDPARDEALAIVDTGAPSGTVVATLRPGYGTVESLLRPAGVVVARAPD